MTMSKQTKNRVFHKILDIAKTNGGYLPVNDPALVQLLGGTMYRLASYIWDVRHYAQLTVTPVRQGRTVIAYEFPTLKTLSVPAEPVQDIETVQEVETVSAPASASV